MTQKPQDLVIPTPNFNWDAIGKLVLLLIEIMKMIFKTVPVPPITSTLWVIALRETKDTTPAQAAILVSLDVQAACTRKNHRWRCCDPNGIDSEGKVPPGIQPYLALAAGKALPRLYLVRTDNGDLLYAGDLPPTHQSFLDLLLFYGG